MLQKLIKRNAQNSGSHESVAAIRFVVKRSGSRSSRRSRRHATWKQYGGTTHKRSGNRWPPTMIAGFARSCMSIRCRSPPQTKSHRLQKQIDKNTMSRNDAAFPRRKLATAGAPPNRTWRSASPQPRSGKGDSILCSTESLGVLTGVRWNGNRPVSSAVRCRGGVFRSTAARRER